MKEKITKQSVLLFEKKGFSLTSIQDIVNELGVTKGTFYYYFSSKEQLLMDIHHEYISNLLERQERIIQNDHLTQTEKLTEIIRLLVSDIVTNGSSARVFFREMRHLAKDNMNKIKEKRELFRLNVEDVVQKGVDQGEFRRSLKPDMIAFGILGVMNWSYKWYNPKGEVTAEELVNIYADMLLHGISMPA